MTIQNLDEVVTETVSTATTATVAKSKSKTSASKVRKGTGKMKSKHTSDVYVRVRPLLDHSAAVLPKLVVESSEQTEDSRTFPAIKGKLPIDGFTGILGMDETNEQVFSRVFLPKMDSIMKGGTASLFCYGYTGAGKTHTTIGYNGESGLFRLAGEDLLQKIKVANESILENEESYLLHASVLEVYNDEVFDLLGGKAKCTLRKNKLGQLMVRGATKKHMFTQEEAKTNGFDFTIVTTKVSTVEISSVDDLDQIQNAVYKFRKVGESTEHSNSSRSHAIFRLDIVNKSVLDVMEELEVMESIKPAIQTAYDKKRSYALRHRVLDIEKKIDDMSKLIEKLYVNAAKKRIPFGGRLILVDLAGADSDVRDVGTNGHTLEQRKESTAINKSLLALKECIRGLASPSAKASSRPSIAFRNSSITRLLEEVLTPVEKRENSSIMIVNISPEASLEIKTLNSLRYGQMFSTKRRPVRTRTIKVSSGGSSLLEVKRKMKMDMLAASKASETVE